MNDPIITYRGASARLSELQSNKRVDQLEQQQATRLIHYRGASMEMPMTKPARRKVTIMYRGATAEVEI